jgi:hypothetical protein
MISNNKGIFPQLYTEYWNGCTQLGFGRKIDGIGILMRPTSEGPSRRSLIIRHLRISRISYTSLVSSKGSRLEKDNGGVETCFGGQNAVVLHNMADLRFVDKHYTMFKDCYELSRTALTNNIAMATESLQ